MNKHPTNIKGYNSPKDLAIELSNLRYDILAEVLKELTDKLECDAKEDLKRNRIKVSHHLMNAVVELQAAYEYMLKVWKICKPLMDDL